MTQPQDQPPATITVSPGGLSTGAHAVHLVVSALTCGLWLPVYLIHVIVAPSRRVSVTGTAEQLAAQHQPQARQPIRFSQVEKLWLFGGGSVLGVLVIVALVVNSIAKTRG